MKASISDCRRHSSLPARPRPGRERRADRVHRRHREPGGHRRRQARRVKGSQRRGQDLRQADGDRPTGVNKQAVALVTKLKVTPEDNPTSQSLKTGGEDNVKNSRRSGAPRSTRPTSTRGRVPRAGARRRRQDADPEREERGAEGADREGAAGIRRAPRARQEAPGCRSGRRAKRAVAAAACASDGALRVRTGRDPGGRWRRGAGRGRGRISS